MVVLSVFILLEILQNVLISYYLGQILWSEVFKGFTKLYVLLFHRCILILFIRRMLKVWLAIDKSY